jgi:hypothetical protein
VAFTISRLQFNYKLAFIPASKEQVQTADCRLQALKDMGAVFKVLKN